MELAQALSPYMGVSSTNFENRYGKLLKTRSRQEIDRFVAALNELEQVKTCLVAKFSDNPLIGYKVRGGLGAICIDCAEVYVTPILVNHGFDTQIVARELPDVLCESGRRLPGIHVYNIVNIGAVDFIVDLDADPFVGRNSGIVVALLQARIPFYSRGFLYHCRRVDRTGRITSYKFLFEDEVGRSHTYLEGDTAEYMTIGPYHNASDQSLCPLCFAGGATGYFGFERYYVGISGPYYRVRFILVCLVSPGEEECTYQVSFDGVAHISARGQKATVVRQSPLDCVLITVTLTSGGTVRLSLAGDGTLAANDLVRFVPAEMASATAWRTRVSAGDWPKPQVILPRPALSRERDWELKTA